VKIYLKCSEVVIHQQKLLIVGIHKLIHTILIIPGLHHRQDILLK
jgi:hypothetical protein